MSDQPALHPLVEGFRDAENYDRGRPRYGTDVVEALVEALDLARGAPVLELGAGTGQLSRALVAGGLDVTAVEPLPATRALLAEAIGEERVRAGVAEQIPLPDGSVDAVLAADSFHWFDQSRAMPEIRRVLRPCGGVAILRSLPKLETPWSKELGALFAAARPAHPGFDAGGAAAVLAERDEYGPVREIVVTSEQVTDRERLLAYFSSFSWVASLPEPTRAELLEQAAELLEQHGVAELPHLVDHYIWVARLG